MSRITLPSGTPAELARPSAEPSRGLVIAPDIMGLRPLFDDMCARLAHEHGWAVCAPEPFPGREHLPMDKREIGSNDDDRVLGDLVDAADLLGVEPVAVLGFCQGGMWAFKAAGTGRFDKAAAFYGLVRVPWARPGHAQPLEWLTRPGAAPVLAIAGGRDQLVPADQVDELRAVPGVEVVFYPDAEHGFAHDPARPSHRADDAADAWRRVLAFLA
ncbi:MAG TPA: dienelactone hydrolase family protein [Acidimicrobiales bacterium]|nr:dienelactone hydrolase family protein [Acidimicrobiales bacterium]